MRSSLLLLAVLSTGCPTDECVDGVRTKFKYVNETAQPVHLFSGFESETQQASLDDCFAGIAPFIVPPSGMREYEHSDTVCRASRVIGIGFGPQGRACENLLQIIPLEDRRLQINLTFTATFTDQGLIVAVDPAQ